MKIALYVMNKAVMSKYAQILYFTDYLKSDPRFEVIAIFDKDNIDQSILRRFSKVIDLRVHEINSLDLDAIIVIDPYSKPIIPYEEIKFPIIYKEYGVAGVEVGYGNLLKKKIYDRSDLIITESDYTYKIIRFEYPDKDIAIGSPAFDYVRDTYDNSGYDPSKIHVVWTPHHSIIHEGQYDNIIGDAYSTFLEVKDYITGKFLSKNPDIVLHIKYHPVLAKRYTQFSKMSGGGTFKSWIRQISRSPQIIVHEDGDYHKLFMNCCLCINDSISFIQEWLPTELPMIVLSNGSKYSSYGEDLVNSCYYRTTPEEFKVLDIKNLIDHDDKKINRHDFMLDHSLIGLSKNCKIISDIIYDDYGRRK